MSTPKQGDVIQNYQGRYAKVVKVKDNHYGLSAFVGKKEDAEKEKVVVKYLNSFGLSQVMGESKVGNGTTKESATPKKSTVTTTAKAGDGDTAQQPSDTQGDGSETTGEGEGEKSLDEMNGKELKAKAKALEISQSGSVDELRARVAEKLAETTGEDAGGEDQQ